MTVGDNAPGDIKRCERNSQGYAAFTRMMQGSIVMSSVRQSARLATLISILLAVLSTPANTQQAATTWVLQKGQNIPSRPAHTPQLRVEGEKLTGSTGCNSFTAKVNQRVDKGVRIERVALTRMLCAPEQNKIEVALVRALEETQFIETKGEKLSFLSAERQPLLVWNAR